MKGGHAYMAAITFNKATQVRFPVSFQISGNNFMVILI